MKRLVWMLVALVAFLGLSILPAAADGGVDGSVVAPPKLGGCVTYGNKGNEAKITDIDPKQKSLSILPVKRWGSTIPMHSRLPLTLNPADIYAQGQVGVLAGTMSMGNAAWQASAAVTEQAGRFCISDQVNAVIDGATALAGSALLDWNTKAGATRSGLITSLVVAVLLFALFRAKRSGGFGQTAGRMVVTLGVLAILVNGALGTTTSAAGAVSFGRGSPGWFGEQVNNTVSGLATAPVDAMNKAAISIIAKTNPTVSAGKNINDCSLYTEVLSRQYQADFSANTWNMAVATTATDAMWRTSGLTTWQNVQFGLNPYADKAGCRLLELSSGVPAKSFMERTASAPSGDKTAIKLYSMAEGKFDPTSLAFSATAKDNEIDNAMIGWAACTIDTSGNIDVDKAWKWDAARNPVTKSLCERFFGQPKSDVLDKGVTAFEFGDNRNDNVTRIGNAPAQAQVLDYVLHLHGNVVGEMGGIAVVYAIASWITAAIFISISLAVIIARLALLMLGLFSIWVLLAGLVKVHEDGSKIGELAKHYVTMAFFSFAAILLMSVTAMVSAIVHQAATLATGGGALASSLSAALSPIAAVVMINWVFTKVLKAPSPFKPTGALAYGAAAGGTSMMAGAGMERMMGGAARKMTGKAKGLARGAMPGGRGGAGARSGGMSPLAALGFMGAGKALDDVADAARDKRAAAEAEAAAAGAGAGAATGVGAAGVGAGAAAGVGAAGVGAGAASSGDVKTTGDGGAVKGTPEEQAAEQKKAHDFAVEQKRQHFVDGAMNLGDAAVAGARGLPGAMRALPGAMAALPGRAFDAAGRGLTAANQGVNRAMDSMVEHPDAYAKAAWGGAKAAGRGAWKVGAAGLGAAGRAAQYAGQHPFRAAARAAGGTALAAGMFIAPIPIAAAVGAAYAHKKHTQHNVDLDKERRRNGGKLTNAQIATQQQELATYKKRQEQRAEIDRNRPAAEASSGAPVVIPGVSGQGPASSGAGPAVRRPGRTYDTDTPDPAAWRLASSTPQGPEQAQPGSTHRPHNGQI